MEDNNVNDRNVNIDRKEADAGNPPADTDNSVYSADSHDSADIRNYADAESSAGTVRNTDAAGNADAEGIGNSEGNVSDEPVSVLAGAKEAEVDYSVASGKSEVVRTTMAFNTDDFKRAGSTYEENSSATSENPAGEYFQEDSINDGVSSDGTAAAAVKKRKPLSDNAKLIIAIVLIVCLCGVAGFGGGAIAVNTLGGGSTGATETIKIDASDAESLNAASAIAKKVMPSVVGISTVSQTYTQTIFGLQQGTSQGVGTGIIVSEDGYILTNSHVIDDGSSSSITVDLYDGTEYTGTVLWNDSTLDLAIVKIDATGLTAAELGDSDEVEIGDYAVAIGNPLGLNFERSVTQGIISGLNRSITTTDGTNTNNMEGLIQTDASINSGNSGGPLINSDGLVIGINTAKASSAEGLGFAIPISTAIPIIEEIKETGTYEQPYLGIGGIDMSTVLANYQTDFNAESGVYVSQIYTGSAAASAGLVEGDIITAIDGETVEDMSALRTMLVKYRPGDTVTITVERNKSNKNIDVVLGSTSDSNKATLQSSSSSSGSSGSNDSSSGYYSYGSSGLDGILGGVFGN